ncbi:MAG: metalloprotease [Thermoplasmata archaeon]|nr:metalloprotease [Thermoplasmata archaeon]
MARFRPNPDFLSGYAPRPTFRLSTSSTELLHLAIAFAVLTVDIAIVRTRISIFTGPSGVEIGVPGFLDSLGVAALAALSGFVAHEMAHKIVAQRQGFWAEFRMSPAGLFFSIASALIGFLFALPGATVIGGMGDVREWGRTSVAGPAVNLSFGAVFLGTGLVVGQFWNAPFVWASLLFLAFVNGIFAAFNLLPFGPLDGTKVLRWSRSIWTLAFGLSLLFIGAVVSVLLYAVPTF